MLKITQHLFQPVQTCLQLKRVMMFVKDVCMLLCVGSQSSGDRLPRWNPFFSSSELAPAVARINFGGTESSYESYELLGIFECSILQDLTLTDLDPEMILVNVHRMTPMRMCAY